MTIHALVYDYLLHPAIGLTLRVTLLALLMQLLTGLPLGLYLAAGKRSLWKSVVEVIITIPMIFPPMALGFFLQFHRENIRLQNNLYLLGNTDCRFCSWFAVYG